MRPDARVNRAVIYGVLILAALSVLFPIYVMVSTSFKELDDLRSGNLLRPPAAPTWAAWAKAWGSACTGVRCDGMAPFVLNSVTMVVPAVLISTVIGAFNGYVLTQWRFRGADLLFTLLL